MNIREKIEIKKNRKKINKTKSWFFEKINKIEKPLARLTKKRREQTQINKIRNEKGEVTTDATEVQKAFRFSTQKNLKTNDNENTTIQNLWDAAKAVLRGKFIVTQAFLKKQRQS